jgi:ABC-type polar amino acid transport system, ATPase component
MTATHLIEVESVTKSYGHSPVLNQISLSVPEHTTTCLIGASGSGKSTLLRCINGLEDIQGGRIMFEGDQISGSGVDIDYVRRNIGMVFQGYNLFPHMSVLENVMLGPRRVRGLSRAVAEEKARSLLSRIGLEKQADSYPDKLSGGQQQRVAIVRALAMEPKVLLLDEITSALDPELVGEVLRLIRALGEGGMTMVLATHEMAFAREAATKVCFLDAGCILEEGPPEQIFSDPREERTQFFLKRIIEAGRL